MPLNGKQKRQLRALGHHLNVVVQVGSDGVTDGVISAADQALKDHELIKVKIAEEDREGRAASVEKLAKTFVLSAVDIGMAPELKTHTDDPPGTAPYRRTWVGIPVWLWVNQPTAATWGPMEKTATLGGVTVTATAKVQSLTWNSGDGQNVTCGEGTQFVAAAYANQAAVDSPTCGLRYQHTSKGGTFTVTATTNWIVEWTGGGQSGNIQMPTTSSSTDVRVGELQSVNVVTPSGDPFH